MNKLQLILVLLLSTFSFILDAEPNRNLPQGEAGPWVVNVHFKDKSNVLEYSQKNRPWKVEHDAKYFIVGVDNLFEYQQLLDYGFQVEINTKWMANEYSVKHTIQDTLNRGVELGGGIPGRSCMRTVEETFETMDDLVAQNPTLASIVDIGDSWIKQNSGGVDGYDMRVIKITNSAIAGEKPILYAMSSIHAREYAPAELNTRFAEHLLNNYGTDADVTWLVDHREIHLLLQGNPDSRKIAEGGVLKRKNQNNNHCSNNVDRGVDMNRNFPFLWSLGTGSSNSACSEVYRGPSNTSEPETTAINNYIKTLFVDARDDDINASAPDDTTGLYIDIHNVASLILFPFGYSNSAAQAPNHNQLQTLGRKFGWYNGYRAEQSNASLGGADGASDDNAYGQLGVASYTFELGGSGFFTQCDEFENNIYPDNLKALVYAAKVADTPYITASGPDVENISLSNTDLAAGTVLSVSAVASDLHFNNNNGTEATQNISSVEMYVDQLPWDMVSTAIMMSPSDGNFDSTSENVNAEIDTTGFSPGQHIIYFQTTDASGITGVPYAVFFNIVDPNLLGSVMGVIKDSATQTLLSSVNLDLDGQQTLTNSQGEYELNSISGTYTLTLSKQGYASQSIVDVSVVAQQNNILNFELDPVYSVLDDNINSYPSIEQAEAAGWSHAAQTGVDDWTIDATGGRANSKAFRTEDVGSTSDKYLISPEIIMTTENTLEFWHKYEFEGSSPMYDGAVLEISSNNGGNWIDLGAQITQGGYTGTLSNGNNPIGGQQAWGGSQTEYTKVVVDLSSYSNEAVKIRWRFGSDSFAGAGAWKIDDIVVLDPNNSSVAIIFANGFEE